MIGYALYMGANFYAVIWDMTIAGVILGFGAAPMWSAKCTYLTQLGVWYSRMTGQSEDAMINRFFGFFFMMFQTSEFKYFSQSVNQSLAHSIRFSVSQNNQ